MNKHTNSYNYTYSCMIAVVRILTDKTAKPKVLTEAFLRFSMELIKVYLTFTFSLVNTYLYCNLQKIYMLHRLPSVLDNAKFI